MNPGPDYGGGAARCQGRVFTAPLMPIAGWIDPVTANTLAGLRACTVTGSWLEKTPSVTGWHFNPRYSVLWSQSQWQRQFPGVFVHQACTAYACRQTDAHAPLQMNALVVYPATQSE